MVIIIILFIVCVCIATTNNTELCSRSNQNPQEMDLSYSPAKLEEDGIVAGIVYAVVLSLPATSTIGVVANVANACTLVQILSDLLHVAGLVGKGAFQAAA